jgi:hypothetical protein
MVICMEVFWVIKGINWESDHVKLYPECPSVVLKNFLNKLNKNVNPCILFPNKIVLMFVGRTFPNTNSIGCAYSRALPMVEIYS